MLALLLVAGSLGLSNFAAAAAAGIGVSGTSGRRRLEVGVVFRVVETATPIVGLILRRRVAHTIGHDARWIGSGLLTTTGLYGLAQGLRADCAAGKDDPHSGRLILIAFELGIDNLAVGFAMGALLGLELGARIGSPTGARGELFGAGVLIAVGAAIAAGAF